MANNLADNEHIISIEASFPFPLCNKKSQSKNTSIIYAAFKTKMAFIAKRLKGGVVYFESAGWFIGCSENYFSKNCPKRNSMQATELKVIYFVNVVPVKIKYQILNSLVDKYPTIVLSIN